MTDDEAWKIYWTELRRTLEAAHRERRGSIGPEFYSRITCITLSVMRQNASVSQAELAAEMGVSKERIDDLEFNIQDADLGGGRYEYNEAKAHQRIRERVKAIYAAAAKKENLGASPRGKF